MDLTLSDEQRLLRESADRFIAETYTADHRAHATPSEPLGFSPAIWKQFADLGWLALPIAEAHGGLGGGAIEIGILMEAFGRGLVSEPYLSTVVLGAGADRRMRHATRRRQALLPQVADGSLRLAFAHSERAARFDLARRRDHGAQGRRRLAPRRPQDRRARRQRRRADHRLGPRRWRTTAQPANCACSWCRATRAGLTLARLSAARRRPRLQSRLSRTSSSRPTPCSATAATRCRRSRPWSTARWPRSVAEAVGIMQTLLDKTLEYTKIRKQFGRPLSANQVIRHRLADMAMQCDEARSMALRAALMADAEPWRAAAPPPAPRPRSANARASSPNSRCSCTAPWASPRSSTSAPTSSGCSPSTRCSAAAPIIIAVTPRSAAGRHA